MVWEVNVTIYRLPASQAYGKLHFRAHDASDLVDTPSYLGKGSFMRPAEQAEKRRYHLGAKVRIISGTRAL